MHVLRRHSTCMCYGQGTCMSYGHRACMDYEHSQALVLQCFSFFAGGPITAAGGTIISGNTSERIYPPRELQHQLHCVWDGSKQQSEGSGSSPHGQKIFLCNNSKYLANLGPGYEDGRPKNPHRSSNRRGVVAHHTVRKYFSATISITWSV